MLFGILLIAVYFRLYRTIHFRSFGTYTLALASFSLFLGFSIRAGIANSAVPSRTSFIIECIALVLGQLFVVSSLSMHRRSALTIPDAARQLDHALARRLPGDL